MSRKLFLAVAAVLGGLLLFAPISWGGSEPSVVRIDLEARSYAFNPSVVQVNRGDHIILELQSMDVTHGVYVDGYGVEATSEPGQTGTLEFVADRVGKFKYRCSLACGPLHPFMIGELIVRPNLPYWRGVGLTLLAAIGSIVYLWSGEQPTGSKMEDSESGRAQRRIELTRFAPLKRLLLWRGAQPFSMLVMLLGFVLVLMTGFLGTPVGSKNLSIVFVWIVWWALLIVVLVPLGGRIWCAICPIPAPGEWLQRRAIVIKRAGPALSLLRKWPRKLNNIWLQNAAFLGVAVFSAVILTRPQATAAVLAGFIVLAMALSLVFERRAFCRYVCPVGGFIGLYSLVAPVELRIKDAETCRNHRDKDCYLGCEAGYGCPWMVKPWRLERNAYCGLCTECFKTCPKDNVAVNLRPIGADLLVKAGHRLDEAYKALIMLTCAVLYSAMFLGPWGWLKDWANSGSLADRASYAAAFLSITLLIVPGLFLGATALSRWLGNMHGVSLKQLFIVQAYILVPMGLGLWVAFSLSFLLVNGSYAISVLSDPFGWGWDLLGTRSFPWTPVLAGVLPYLQIGTVLVSLVFTIRVAYRRLGHHGIRGTPHLKATLPMAGFVTSVSLVFLRLYLG